MDAIAVSRKTSTRWTPKQVLSLFELPFMDLLYQAQEVHRTHHDPHQIQLSSLLSIKTGGCPEDCKYCPQSAQNNTDVERERLLALQEVQKAAQNAKDSGATRFCMGAAWRGPKDHHLEDVIEMVKMVKSMGLEACVTLGMLKEGQAEKLKEAGLDYYNHNLDTSPEFYGQIITTRTYQDRLDTLERVRHAGIKVCCGGIVGLGESRAQRAGLLSQLANLNPPPESVPINQLVKVAGTPLAEVEDIDEFEFIRTIAVARIIMPTSHVRLSAGRESMSDGTQALCFLAGANSIFYGEELLTTANPKVEADKHLLNRLNLIPRT
ncbi:biotin synthase BioB [Pelistega sp. NLN82]|uniref:Biotin synthase n=1 Tax=Pelistega ratti TaxID=2652177 RepID=A0A6L9Y353_9BURK|nr:biotin synthase BioB [Pelistega ratti]NEN74791.1 biotin synthase BioB [Pelistega ratti]